MKIKPGRVHSGTKFGELLLKLGELKPKFGKLRAEIRGGSPQM